MAATPPRRSLHARQNDLTRSGPVRRLDVYFDFPQRGVRSYVAPQTVPAERDGDGLWRPRPPFIPGGKWPRDLAPTL